MTWSVSALGRAGAVRKEIARQFAQGGKCAEPEESVRQSAAQLLDSSLAAQDETSVVEVAASGSQGFKNWNDKSGVTNQLSIAISPKYGFIEEAPTPTPVNRKNVK